MAKRKPATTPDGGPAALTVETVPVDSLHLDPSNARRHPSKNIDAIKASLARFGQQRPLLVDGNDIVRAGNGTLEAARALGWPTVAIVRTPLVGSEATAYAIADNRTAELGSWDDDALISTLESLRDEGFDPAATGFDDADLAALLGGPAPDGEPVDDPEGEWRGMPEFAHEDQTSKYKVHVHLRNDDDLKAFEELIGQHVPRDRWAIWYPPAEIGRYADKRYVADGDDDGSGPAPDGA